ncbi:MAG: glycosyltransferase [Elusimicrobia bacterium]|nr:glycosyltransferase [Elusimicrobiota bacterium]
MRILNIITRLDKGGSAENTIYCAISLKDQYDSFLISGLTNDPTGTTKNILSKHRINYYCIPELVRSIHPCKDLVAFFKLYCFIKKHRFRLVHTHTSKAGILGRWAAWLAGVRIIVHTPHGHVFSGYYGRWVSLFFLWLERITARITATLIALTPAEERAYHDYRVKPMGSIAVIHSGITMGRFLEAKPDTAMIRKSLGFDTAVHIVGTVTRLEPVKGTIDLINAWQLVLQQFPDARLMIVGDGSLRNELVSRTHILGICSSVIFTGLRYDLPEILSVMRFLVLPSLNEGMGKVIVQAALMGKPTIGTKVCGIPDMIQHNQTGLLVPPKDHYALSRAIIRLLEDDSFTQKLAARAKQWVLEPVDGFARFSKELMVHRLNTLYRAHLTSH